VPSGVVPAIPPLDRLPVVPSAAPSTPTQSPPPVATGAASTQGDDAHYTVMPGDTLWSIAVAELAADSSQPTQDAIDGEISAYWRRLIDANHGRFASGDPNLIYTGETVIRPNR
jgi:nucleoid-associated protein YgaU